MVQQTHAQALRETPAQPVEQTNGIEHASTTASVSPNTGRSATTSGLVKGAQIL